ncbi:mxl-3 [Pristionchus pacificus]|uniref:Mxl-3 n=1 Tax=Pristionchus pacificus TaxID=54126 RepID=A0A2A6B5D8_PRIPA|nr:mxl-3 [Pristionchus pacificus]|eukprot:PDM61092.1 mxl-3 [Pristionchus pacificus]
MSSSVYTSDSIMVPVLLQSSLSSMILPPPPESTTAIRGRKRTNETYDGHLFAKRNSNSDLSDDDSASTPRKGSPGIDDERRAHHNELERRRRDHIKDHFMSLKDAIPLLEGEKSSRALILKRAVEYISIINQRVTEQAMIIEELQRKNDALVQCKEPSASPSLISVAAPPATGLPTTSSASVVPLQIESIPSPHSSTSSFSPVIPSHQPQMVYQQAPAPQAAAPTLADLTMLLALQQQQQAQTKSMDALLTKDLATLLSLNSLKDHSSHFMTPLLF